jgi:hypothetical protein
MSKETNAPGLRHTVLQLLAGGLSGSVAKSSVAPLDRVKILYQVGLWRPHLLVLGSLLPQRRDQGSMHAFIQLPATLRELKVNTVHSTDPVPHNICGTQYALQSSHSSSHILWCTLSLPKRRRQGSIWSFWFYHRLLVRVGFFFFFLGVYDGSGIPHREQTKSKQYPYSGVLGEAPTQHRSDRMWNA